MLRKVLTSLPHPFGAGLLLALALFGPGAPALAQTTVTLQQGLNNYSGTAATRVMNEDALEGGPPSFAIINESSTSMAVRFAIFAAEGGPVPNGSTSNPGTPPLSPAHSPGAPLQR